MDDITQNLQKLTKSRKLPKLIYKQSNQRISSFFVDELAVTAKQ
jgi:hypothetical protein